MWLTIGGGSDEWWTTLKSPTVAAFSHITVTVAANGVAA
jgi:hypothetical protein